MIEKAPLVSVVISFLNPGSWLVEAIEIDMVCEVSWFWYSWVDASEKNYLQKVGVPEGLYYAPQVMKAYILWVKERRRVHQLL